MCNTLVKRTMTKTPISRLRLAHLALFLVVGLATDLSIAQVEIYAHSRQLPRNPPGEGLLSKSRAAAIAQARYGGKVLKVKRNGESYRVKLLLASGHVKHVVVDGRSGNIVDQ